MNGPLADNRRHLGGSLIRWSGLIVLVVLMVVITLITAAFAFRQAVLASQLIRDRSRWPSQSETLVVEGNLSPTDIQTIEVVSFGVDGWCCRMRATPSTVKFVKTKWVPLEQVDRIAGLDPTWDQVDWAKHQFRSNLPDQFQIKKADTAKFYANQNWHPGEEGRDNFLAMLDQEQIVIWYYWNF